MYGEWKPIRIKPDKTGHYLTLSHLNWYHGGCFDKNRDGTTLSMDVAYYSGAIGAWNKYINHIVAWTELPDIPEVYRKLNLEFQKEHKSGGD